LRKRYIAHCFPDLFYVPTLYIYILLGSIAGNLNTLFTRSIHRTLWPLFVVYYTEMRCGVSSCKGHGVIIIYLSVQTRHKSLNQKVQIMG